MSNTRYRAVPWAEIASGDLPWDGPKADETVESAPGTHLVEKDQQIYDDEQDGNHGEASRNGVIADRDHWSLPERAASRPLLAAPTQGPCHMARATSWYNPQSRCRHGRAVPLGEEESMKTYPAEQIHNVVLISHGGAGKTTLIEALLYMSGAITRLGRVEEGNTTSDFDPDEIKRQVDQPLARADRVEGDKLNVLDTPGYADFFGEVVRRGTGGRRGVVVVDGVSGVQVGTEQVWRRRTSKLPRLIVVNKLDRENAELRPGAPELRRAYGNGVVPLATPVGAEKGLRGVVDLLTAGLRRWAIRRSAGRRQARPLRAP